MPETGAIDLDHVAIALERWSDAFDRYGRDLGGEWWSSWDGGGAAFAPCQLRFANRMKVELLQPQPTRADPFLRRFLDHNGAGPHHFTFKVPDLDVALARSRAAGFSPVGEDRSDPYWLEAFLHPKDTGIGILVQFAQTPEGNHTPPSPPADYPAERAAPAALAECVLAVRDVNGAARVFVELLDGVVEADGVDADGPWWRVRWPGAGRIVLRSPAHDGDRWDRAMGTWGGRLHHLTFTGVEPATLATGTSVDDATVALPNDDRTGTRVLARA